MVNSVAMYQEVGLPQRYEHRPAVVLLRSGALRDSLAKKLSALGAVVANLHNLPSAGNVQDLLASGFILLAPPDETTLAQGADQIQGEEPSVQDSVNAVMEDLEQRGVLPSTGLVFPGEGI